MINRRSFVKQMGQGSLLLAANGLPQGMFDKGEITKVTILHTNDMHSRIEPFPMNGGRFQGLGGVAKRAALLKQIRENTDHVLLLDSGDIFQGTPYFNFYGGELEFKLMSEMAYDVATLGNHDFDAGVEGFHKQLQHANFEFVNANYRFDNTLLADKVKPYTVIQKGNIRFGIFGIGIELEGLVPSNLYAGIQYENPIEKAQLTAKRLLEDEGCHYIICLSHLGYKYREGNQVCDIDLAKQTSNINLILGGHTHTFMREIDIHENKEGKPVYINQAGWAGILLGKIDLYFENNRLGHCKSCKNLRVN